MMSVLIRLLIPKAFTKLNVLYIQIDLKGVPQLQSQEPKGKALVWLREQQYALAQHIFASTPVELPVNQFYNRCKKVTY